MIVNIAFVEAIFFLLFMIILLATMPNVAWIHLLIAALATNTILPIVFYPYSKTLWMAGDLYMHPLEEQERSFADSPGPGRAAR